MDAGLEIQHYRNAPEAIPASPVDQPVTPIPLLVLSCKYRDDTEMCRQFDIHLKKIPKYIGEVRGTTDSGPRANPALESLEGTTFPSDSKSLLDAGNIEDI